MRFARGGWSHEQQMLAASSLPAQAAARLVEELPERDTRFEISFAAGTRLATSKSSSSSASSQAVQVRLPVSLEYLRESRRPLVSLAFVLPLLALYEGGVLYLGPGRDAQRGRRLAPPLARPAGLRSVFSASRADRGIALGLAPHDARAVACAARSALGYVCRKLAPGRGAAGHRLCAAQLSHLALEFIQAQLPAANVPAGGGWDAAAPAVQSARCTRGPKCCGLGQFGLGSSRLGQRRPAGRFLRRRESTKRSCSA